MKNYLVRILTGENDPHDKFFESVEDAYLYSNIFGGKVWQRCGNEPNRYWKLIRSERSSTMKEIKWYVVAGFDFGDAESGPMVHTDWCVVTARTEEEAMKISRFAEESCYCGGYAEPATEEQIKEWERICSEEPYGEELPFEI